MRKRASKGTAVESSERVFHLLRRKRDKFSFSVAPLLMVDTTGCEMLEMLTLDEISKANEGEVGLVVSHVESLVKSGLDPSEIAVVTPYNLQVELIRSDN